VIGEIEEVFAVSGFDPVLDGFGRGDGGFGGVDGERGAVAVRVVFVGDGEFEVGFGDGIESEAETGTAKENGVFVDEQNLEDLEDAVIEAGVLRDQFFAEFVETEDDAEGAVSGGLDGVGDEGGGVVEAVGGVLPGMAFAAGRTLKMQLRARSE
jgi:hypothetical protein